MFAHALHALIGSGAGWRPRSPRWPQALLAVLLAAGLPGCASTPAPGGALADATGAPHPATVDVAQVPQRWQALRNRPVLLLGELHDDPAQPPLQQALVQALLAHGQLAALVLEMAEQGRSTQGLPPQADAATVQAALAWSDAAWPWSRYGPTVMAAVAAGVPVLGGNLPRARMRGVMADAAWDGLLDAPGLAAMGEKIREGHCGLLPPAQIPGMVRIQVARDRAMAETVRAAWRPGATVLLLAGNEHVRAELGIPRHLGQLPTPWPGGGGAVASVQLRPLGPTEAPVAGRETVWPTPPQPARDHCAELRRQLRQSGP